ncbi:hypothetical protein G7Y79_00060g092510 [Physcia stellaris]|nr:hypothetical protein G7Y79_00060g092510 [Physcia stellaris]
MDLLPYDFPNIRIFTCGYDSKVTHWFKGPAMQLDIYSYGESLLNGVEARRREDPRRRLIFIVHSLGGLIIKDALRRARTAMDDRFRAIYESTAAIFFLGTPHRGGSYVNIGLTVRKITACAGFDTNDKVLRDLKFDSVTAKLLREEFAKMLDDRRPKIYTFQEAIGLSGFGPLSGKVVVNASSALDYALEQKDFINANHVDMCRFSGVDDDGSFIRLASRSASSIFRRPSQLTKPKEILKSLFQPETQERFDQVNQAYEKTCGWLFEDETIGFVKWLRSGEGIFWISGKPGSGKSTLMKYAVTDPRTFQNLYANHKRNRWIWAEFFFSERGAQEQKTLEGLLHRILFQLLSQAEELTEIFADVYQNSVSIQGEWLLIYLERTLINIATQRKVRLNICLFIDALDEHSEHYDRSHWRLIEILQAFVAKSDGRFVKIMLCLSSRPENVFKDVFRKSPSFQVHLQTNFDIQIYVHSRINTYLASRDDLSSNPEVITSLTATCEEIARRAQGVFLWVALVTTDMIEALIDGESPEDLQQTLSSIQGDGDLYHLYHRILLRLKAPHLREAFVMLQIAYAAIEPWPVTEFFEAVGFTCSCTKRLDLTVRHPSDVELERRLVSRCRGFLELQDSVGKGDDPALGLQCGGKVVQFLHRTVKEFLATSKSFDDIHRRLGREMVGDGHLFIAEFRIRQHFRWYAHQPLLVGKVQDKRKHEIFYQAMMAEVTSGHAIGASLDELSEFIQSHELAFAYFEKVKHVSSWRKSFLALAVCAGLIVYVNRVLTERPMYMQPRDVPLLHYAISRGRIDTKNPLAIEARLKMIRLLISKGADLEMAQDGLTAFAFAFRVYVERIEFRPNRRDIFILLLEAGASVNVGINEFKHTSVPYAVGMDDIMPLKASVRKKDRELTKLLLVHGASFAALDPADWEYMRKYDKPMLHLVKQYHDKIIN